MVNLKKNPLIAIVNMPDPDLAVELAEVLVKNGIKSIEITFRNEHAAQSIRNIKQANIPIECGAGTVRTLENAQDAIETGVDFMVSPGFNAQIIKYVKENSSIPFYPGVDSTIGIELANDLGLKILKLFPCSVVGGIKWLKAMAGPYYDIKFIPTGGVSFDNLEEFLRLPNVVSLGGSFLAPSGLIKAKAWDEIAALCKKSMEIVEKVKSEQGM